MRILTIALICTAVCGAQTTVNGGRTHLGSVKVSGASSSVDFSAAGSTTPVKTGALSARPAACTQGQIYFATDATAGQNLYYCTATNTWTQQTAAASQPMQRCSIVIGSDGGAALVNSDLALGRWCMIPQASTIVEVTVAADGGTPNVIVGRNRSGVVANIVSSALATAASGGLACARTSSTVGVDGATTCSATLQNTSLSPGDWLNLVSGTAGGTAKRMSVVVTYTVN